MAGFLELSVYGFSDPRKRLDILPRRSSPAVLDEIEGPGSGQFTIYAKDMKLQETPGLLDYRNVVKMTRDGVVEGAFIIQHKEDALVSSYEEAGKQVVVSGEGLRAWFRDAAVAPYGGIKAGSKDERVFSWASEKGTWFKAADWKPAVNSWPWQLIPDLTIWPLSPYRFVPANWPDAPNAWWVWSQHNSATKPVPLGDAYFRYEFDTTVAGSYSVFAAGDNTLHGFVDGEEILDSGDDMFSFNKTWRADFELSPGHHILAIKVSNTDGASGGLLAALFRVGDAASNIPATLISYTGAPGWLINAYPAKEPGWNVGEILIQLLAEARDRNVKFPLYLTPTFTATKDSAGNAWETTMPWKFSVGDEYFDVITQLEELACDVWINPDTYELNVWNKRGKDRTVQSQTAEPVVFREGKNLAQAAIKGQGDIKNALLVLTDDGWIEAEPETSASSDLYGRIEGKLNVNVGLDAARQLAKKTFEQKQAAEEGSTYEIVPVEGAWPLRDFFVGDWVLAPSKNELIPRRVVSISSTEVAANGAPSYSIEFDTIFQTREAQLEKMVKIALGGGSVGSSGTGRSSSPSNSSIGGEPGNIPAAPTGVSVSSVGKWNAGGGTVSQVTVRWNKVSQNYDGSLASGIAYYEVLGRLSNSPDDGLRVLASVPGTQAAATIDGVAAGVSWDFYVRAATSAVRVSENSVKVVHVTTMPAATLLKPTTPTVSTSLGTVTARWDGLLDGNTTPPVFLSYVYAEYSTAENGTYTAGGASINAAGSVVVTDLDVGSLYWIRLVAVDLLARKSAPSTAVSVTVEGFDADELAGEIRDELDQAKADAADALAAADKAATDAGNALTAANSKTRNIYQPTKPSGTNYQVGDTWFDTDDGNRISRWDGSDFVATPLGTASIAAGAITADSGIIASLDAGTITAGTLSSARIGAQSITADKILVGSSTNVFVGGGFEGTSPFTNTDGANRASIDSTFARTGTKSLKIVQGSAGDSLTSITRFPVAQGDKVTFSFWAFSPTGYSNAPTTNRVNVVSQSGSNLASFTVGAGALAANRWTNIGPLSPVTIPSGVTEVYVAIAVAPGSTVGTLWIDDVSLTVSKQGALVVDGTLLVDGTISSTKLVANSITGDQIKANSITAGEIQAGTITANEVAAGTLTATQLAANSITTEKLAADAITAKHTITGAQIQTAASGARTEMTSQGFRTLNASGAELLRIGYGQATGMSLLNPATNTLVPLADAAFGAQAAAVSDVMIIRIDPNTNYPFQAFGDNLSLTFRSWSSKVVVNWGAHIVVTAGSYGVAWPYFMIRLLVNGVALTPNGVPVTGEASTTDYTWGATITGSTSISVTPGASVTLRVDYKIVTGSMDRTNMSINNRFIAITPAN